MLQKIKQHLSFFQSYGTTKRPVVGIPLRTWEDWESGRRAMPEYQLRMMVYYVKLAFSYKKDGVHSVNIIRDEKGNAKHT